MYVFLFHRNIAVHINGDFFLFYNPKFRVVILLNWFHPSSFHVLSNNMYVASVIDCELSLVVRDFRNNCLQRMKSDSRIFGVIKSVITSQFSSLYYKIFQFL